MDLISWPSYLPESGISVEMADDFIALLDLAEEVFLAWDFSVLAMTFIQKLLKKHPRGRTMKVGSSVFVF